MQKTIEIKKLCTADSKSFNILQNEHIFWRDPFKKWIEGEGKKRRLQKKNIQIQIFPRYQSAALNRQCINTYSINPAHTHDQKQTGQFLLIQKEKGNEIQKIYCKQLSIPKIWEQKKDTWQKYNRKNRKKYPGGAPAVFSLAAVIKRYQIDT